jgi:hypothetical protein
MNSSDIKQQYVKDILANPTYLPESGLYKNLEKALMKMNRADLAGLEIIIKLKMLQAEGK